MNQVWLPLECNEPDLRLWSLNVIALLHFKTFAKEQIRAKFEHFEGQVKSSKVKSHMNWWVKCISAVIAKTASRNVAFKARRLRESIMEGQDSFIMREPEDAEVEFGEDGEDVVVVVVADAGVGTIARRNGVFFLL